MPSSQSTLVTLEGEGFYAHASVDLGGGSPATIDNTWSVSLDNLVLSPTAMVSAGDLRVEVPAGLTPGSYDVFVSSPTGKTDLLEDGLVVVDDEALTLSIETAAGGVGQSVGDQTIAVGQDLELFAVGRHSGDGSFLLDVDATWSLDTGIGVLSGTQGSTSTFASSELGDNIVRLQHADYGTAQTGTISVVDGPPAGTSAELVFDNSGIAEDLLRFPVLVTLDPSNFNYDLAAAQGADLRFIDDDDVTVLPHEIDEWNEGGVSQVWVGVPQIDANSTIDHIHLEYGDMDQAPGEDPDNVWTGYHAVWHLGESGTGVDGEFADSSSPTHSGQGGSGTPSQVPQPTTGKIGQGQSFDGNDDRITIDPSDSFLFATDTVTVSYWVSVPNTNSTMVAVGKGGNPGGYRSGIEAGGQVGWYVSGTLMDTPSPEIVDSSFHQIVVTWNGTRMNTYVDGVPIIGVNKGGGFNNNNDPFYIGRGPSSFHFGGIIDEVRVLDYALSDAWIAAQHRSVQNNYISFE